MSFVKEHARSFVLLSVLFAGVIITAPYLNFQDFLAQGDHGLNLYVPWAVSQGELPYRDFWWPFGPLMPFYYSLFYKFFGVSITSIILGKLLMKILAGLLVCLAMMEAGSLLGAFLCSCWFLLFSQDFFYGYNHVGGLAMVIGVVFCLLKYIRTKSTASAWGALGFILVLCLIKLNFGLASLAVCLITVTVCDHVDRIPFLTSKKLFCLGALIVLPLSLVLIYASLLRGLSFAEITQCLPYLPGYDPSSVGFSSWTAVSTFFKITLHTVTSNWENFTFALIINASALRCAYLVVTNKLTSPLKTIFLLSLSMLCLFYLVNCHEYLKSGVWYRIFWAQPLSIMISFLLIDTALRSVPKIMRALVFLFIALLCVYCWNLDRQQVNAQKIPSQYFALPRAGIYTTNAPVWTATVEETTAFLNKTLKKNELFFALPYDDLYYYLTGKKAPTRQLIFFDYLNIPPSQERSVVAELEKNHVNYVLISNRAYLSREPGLGFLGKTYCPILAAYIHDHFLPIAQFGDWKNEAGWAWNHGTMVLKRQGL